MDYDNLITAFILQELNTYVSLEDEEYLDKVWKEMHGTYTSKLYVYVDGEEGDRNIIEFRQLVGDREFQLGAWINEGRGQHYYIFTDYFIAQCAVIIGKWMDQKINKIYHRFKLTDFELDEKIVELTLKLK